MSLSYFCVNNKHTYSPRDFFISGAKNSYCIWELISLVYPFDSFWLHFIFSMPLSPNKPWVLCLFALVANTALCSTPHTDLKTFFLFITCTVQRSSEDLSVDVPMKSKVKQLCAKGNFFRKKLLTWFISQVNWLSSWTPIIQWSAEPWKQKGRNRCWSLDV